MAVCSKPSFVRSTSRFDLSRILKTVFSPKRHGSTETRKSISRFLPSLSFMRPSWGSLRSAISSLLMILRREVSAAFILVGRFMTVWSTPSTRYLTRREVS